MLEILVPGPERNLFQQRTLPYQPRYVVRGEAPVRGEEKVAQGGAVVGDDGVEVGGFEVLEGGGEAGGWCGGRAGEGGGGGWIIVIMGRGGVAVRRGLHSPATAVFAVR